MTVGRRVELGRLTLLLAMGVTLLAAEGAPAPLRILLLTGAQGHDHATQKDLLKAGIEARVHAVVDCLHTPGDLRTTPLPILGKPDYATGYDLVIHDVMTPGLYAPEIVRAVLKPHLVDGIPAVALHVGVSAYRSGANDRRPGPRAADDLTWTEFTGAIVHGHGASAPIAISFIDATHPVARTLSDWTTVPEELYHEVEVFPATRVIARGRLLQKMPTTVVDGRPVLAAKPEEAVLAWTNLALGRVRVFSTSLGHQNQTVADPRYLDLVANGVLWATDRLDDEGRPKPGCGPAAK
jgi:type 1 glutamine amidotransferase